MAVQPRQMTALRGTKMRVLLGLSGHTWSRAADTPHLLCCRRCPYSVRAEASREARRGEAMSGAHHDARPSRCRRRGVEGLLQPPPPLYPRPRKTQEEQLCCRRRYKSVVLRSLQRASLLSAGPE